MTDAYQKAYEREKYARLAAEKILDEKTREVQLSLEMIQYQFNDLMQQKKESDYFLAVAKLAKNESGVTDIVNQYMLDTVDFIEAKIGRYSYLKEGEVVCSNVVGLDQDLPEFSKEIYTKIYAIQSRSTHNIKDIKQPEIIRLMESNGVNRVVLIPIKCFGEVSTVCEVYLSKSTDFKSKVLDQCQLAGYQIGGIIEANITAKKLEGSYLDLKLSNEKLKQAQSQLIHSEKMASLGQLAAGIAHEINNPVGFVTSNIGILKEYIQLFKEYFSLIQLFLKNPNNELKNKIKNYYEQQNYDFILNDTHELIDESVGGLKRVKDIVDNLKSFSRADDEKYEPFNINECIENVIKVAWNELKYHVTLKKIFEKDLPKINGHEGQIGQVVMNILVNAAQSIKTEGNVEIKTSQSVGKVLVEIKDNGDGMSESVKDRIFDPFFTTKAVNEGTGLGLSISYGIIEKHGGSISLQSEEGRGSSFTISLPVIM